MSKDFQEQVDLEFRESQHLDPFVFATPEMAQFLKRVNDQMTIKFIYSYVALNALLAPLQTIATSLQLSVKKHRDLFQSEQAKSKELAKLNTELTVHEKRKFELMLRAGGKTIPYTAPVYGGYKETIEGLKSQEWRAFFKGAAFRSCANILYFYPLTKIPLMISSDEINEGPIYKGLKLYGSCLLIDLIVNPIYVLENRYILQNNIKEFKIFRKPFKAIRKIAEQGEAFKGLSFHLINNTVGFITRFPIYISLIGNQGIKNQMYGTFMLGELFTYPFSTAYKRLQCQTERYPGMIPVRYSGLYHAVKVIMYEEGVKGLYKGFSIHTAQSLVRLKCLESLNRGKIEVTY